VAVQAAALDSVGGRLIEVVHQENAHSGTGPLAVIELGADASVENAVSVLTHLPGVAFAEPNGIISLPDWEPMFSSDHPGHPVSGVPAAPGDAAPVTNAPINHGSEADAPADAVQNRGSIDLIPQENVHDGTGPLGHNEIGANSLPVDAAPLVTQMPGGIISVPDWVGAMDPFDPVPQVAPIVAPNAVSTDPYYTDGRLWGMQTIPRPNRTPSAARRARPGPPAIPARPAALSG